MKKLFKIRLISVLSLVAVTLTFAVITAYAEDTSSDCIEVFYRYKNGDMGIEEYDKYLDTLSEEELTLLEQEITASLDSDSDGVIECCIVSTEYNPNYLDSLSKEELTEYQQEVVENEMMAAQISNELSENNSQVSMPRVYKISLPGTFTIYQQQNNAYCGAACVQSALMYLNGSAPSQNSIYLRVFNEFPRVRDYMNVQQDKCTYLFCQAPSKNLMLTHFLYDIAFKEVPSFARIEVENREDWYYRTNGGHCLLVNAIYNDRTMVQFADPSANSQTSWKPFYIKHADQVAKVCKDIIHSSNS